MPDGSGGFMENKKKSAVWKSVCITLMALCVVTACAAVYTVKAYAAAGDGTIKKGIYVENIELAGLTPVEAKARVEEKVEAMKQTPVVLEATDGESISVMVGDFGISWANPEIIEEAAMIGTQGNIVKRFKELKDLERESKVFPLQIEADKAAITALVEEQEAKYNIAAVNASLTRENGQFSVKEGETGVKLNTRVSAERVYEYIVKEWDGSSDIALGLEIEVEEPQGKAEDLLKVKDVLGTFTTSYKTSGAARSANVSNGAKLINGTTIYPGEEFSTYRIVSPFTEANGYYPAGSYLNGMVVDSFGGGICQVSTTLYNAVLLSELDVTERHNHSMIVTYVKPSADAAIAESAGKDFRFVNNTEYPIYIEGVTADKQLTFTIYGVDERAADRTVTYESETLSVINPESEKIIVTTSRPIGFVDVQSAHTGYKAKLWKVVTENGVEVSRTEVNKSSYMMTPRTATVGIATGDPNAFAAMQEAIATGSIDHVRAIAGALSAPPPQPMPPIEAPAE